MNSSPLSTTSRSRRPARSLRIAMIGSAGAATANDGFETAVKEIGGRLAERGHEVNVYRPRHITDAALSLTQAVSNHRPDAAFVFDSTDALFVHALRLRHISTAVHVDVLDRGRGRWGRAGRLRRHWAEWFAVRWADAVIADSTAAADYFLAEFSVPARLIACGTTIRREAPSELLADLELQPGGYHLVDSRFEGDNSAEIIDGYQRSGAQLPLAVVGPTPRVPARRPAPARPGLADSRVHLLGDIQDRDRLDQLYAHAVTYLHGQSSGAAPATLLRAMGAGTAVIAWDTTANRDVLGPVCTYFDGPDKLALLIEDAELSPHRTAEVGESLQGRAQARYNWDDVARGYENLALTLAEENGMSGQPADDALGIPEDAPRASARWWWPAILRSRQP